MVCCLTEIGLKKIKSFLGSQKKFAKADCACKVRLGKAQYCRVTHIYVSKSNDVHVSHSLFQVIFIRERGLRLNCLLFTRDHHREETNLAVNAFYLIFLLNPIHFSYENELNNISHYILRFLFLAVNSKKKILIILQLLIILVITKVYGSVALSSTTECH